MGRLPKWGVIFKMGRGGLNPSMNYGNDTSSCPEVVYEKLFHCRSFPVRSSRPEVFSKKAITKNFDKFTGKLRRKRSCRLPASKFFKKETPVLVFSCEFCQIFMNKYFVEHLETATSLSCELYEILQNSYSIAHLQMAAFLGNPSV